MKRILVLSFLFSSIALADAQMIAEMEELYNSLSANDRGRPELALRMADLSFEEARRLRMEAIDDKGKLAQANRFTKKAVGLYRGALQGFKGYFPKATGTKKIKINFQLARLYQDSGKKAQAFGLWEQLAEQKKIQKIQREASLRLAERYENSGSQSQLNLAEKYYNRAFSLCAGGDTCSYINYRKAWIFYRKGQLGNAISTIEKGLVDGKGQLREEAVRDYVVFLSRKSSDGRQELIKIQNFAEKHKRPDLVESLADAYFSSGNRLAGTLVLEEVALKNPSAFNSIRLMEEYYGFRNWQGFQAQSSKLKKQITPELITGLQDKTRDESFEAEKILRRLTVQLDGERKTNPGVVDDFKNTVMIYLSLFPTSKERMKMMDGWLVAEKNPKAKISQLKSWISETKNLRFRKMRAALAQKEKNFEVVAEEMAALAQVEKKASKKREYIYHQAHAYYEKQNYEKSIPLFRQLSQIKESDSRIPDQWAVQSLHLILDVLNLRKNFQEVAQTARTWTNHPRFKSWVKQPKAAELRELPDIIMQADFENAVAKGENPEALVVFEKMCVEKKLLPKSCNNAKILAVKLKSQESLITILEEQKDTKNLTVEYEASGYFARAADLLAKKLNKKSPMKDYLRLALFYELGGDLKKRDSYIKKMIKSPVVRKSWAENEKVIYGTLKDANLVNKSVLKQPYSAEMKLLIAEELQRDGKGSPAIRKMIEKSCKRSGDLWGVYALEKLKSLDAKQAKISFYGRRSKRKFKRRIAGLQKLVKQGNCYLEGGTAQERVIFATLLARAHNKFGQEILDSPIPEGIPEEAIIQVKQSLNQMAMPFVEKGQQFEALGKEQLAKVTDEAEQKKTAALIEGAELSLTVEKAKNTFKPLDVKGIASALTKLKKNPNDVAVLESISQSYKAGGRSRLAAYFDGRIRSLKEGR